MSENTEIVNPISVLRSVLVEKIKALEEKGKNPKTLRRALELFEGIKEAHNNRVRGLKELRTFVTEAITAAEENGKNTKTLVELLGLVNSVASINHGTVAKLRVELAEKEGQLETANQANESLLSQAEKMEAALANGPAGNRVQIQRPTAQILVSNSEGSDEVITTADPEEVLSRIVPIVDESSDVIGYAVLMSFDVRHLFYFHRFLGELQIARGSMIDVEANPSDGLLVYQVTLNTVVALADKFAQLFGSLTKIAGYPEQIEHTGSGESVEGAVSYQKTANEFVPASRPQASAADDSEDDSEDDDSEEGDHIVTLGNESEESADDIEEEE